ncbi:MAG: hypothetical protein HOC71_09790 [Candidatus Latescibacteria bacterium]|jgi:hypothetical protein|nr:hypothetical protein [Candidatus Latescibacterota bacterium]
MNNWILTDDFIRQNNARILVNSKIQPRYVNQPQSEKHDNSNTEDSVSDLLKECLWAIKKLQFKKPLTEIQKSTGLPAGTFSRIIQKLGRKKFVKVIQLPFGRGRPKYPVLLPDGYKELGIQEKKYNGKGAGYEHTLYQYLIVEYFSDFNPEIELNRNEKFIDVGIERNEKLIAIEVAMTPVHEKENIEKDITLAKADYVIVACINKKVQEKVKEIVSQMPENFQNKSEVCLLSEFLKRKPEELLINQTKLNL